ncbi:hypothetical protein F2Q68_00041316 [Brassica cretica]|uniref:Myb-like domain-containing protein n=1 Tax=Brassica cretica TaxID=69181 RepID=A0A8S9MQ82_BRACR|nr:hypothetical protein F2Q68_00041316 [Brassica cretica]
MDSNPFMQSSNFVELLNSQQSISFGNYEDSSALSSSQVSSLDTDDVGERRERRKWTPTDDIVLIRAKIQWLATSKNQAPSGRELQLTLGQVQSLLAANRGKLVTKWCDLSTAKNDGGSKKRKCDDGADSSSSQATETKRPAGVKAAKARGKKTMAEENALNEFQRMWDIKHNENDMLHVVLFHVSSSCLDSLATLLSQTLLYEFDSCNTQVLGASVCKVCGWAFETASSAFCSVECKFRSVLGSQLDDMMESSDDVDEPVVKRKESSEDVSEPIMKRKHRRKGTPYRSPFY